MLFIYYLHKDPFSGNFVLVNLSCLVKIYHYHYSVLTYKPLLSREVCTIAKELRSKSNPVTKCEKVPQQLCGPAGCGFVPGPEQCHEVTMCHLSQNHSIVHKIRNNLRIRLATLGVNNRNITEFRGLEGPIDRIMS